MAPSSTDTPIAPIKLRIVIDNEDAADAPDRPLTLNVYRSWAGGDDSFEMSNPDDESAIGSSVPDMLRELADNWHSSDAHPDDGTEPETCSECGDVLVEGPGGGDHGMCGSCLHNALRSGWEPGSD